MSWFNPLLQPSTAQMTPARADGGGNQKGTSEENPALLSSSPTLYAEQDFIGSGISFVSPGVTVLAVLTCGPAGEPEKALILAQHKGKPLYYQHCFEHVSKIQPILLWRKLILPQPKTAHYYKSFLKNCNKINFWRELFLRSSFL